MLRAPTLKSVMTPFPSSIDAEAPVREAIEFMREAGFRHLPVTVDGTVQGVVSDRDIQLILGPDFAYPREDEVRVKDAIAGGPHVVDINTRLDSALHYLVEHHIDSVAVTKHGKLVGIFTATDACRAFAEHLGAFFNAPGDDAA